MTCQLPLRPELLKLCIPYKYVVYTTKSISKHDGWYEFIRLPDRRSGDPNRVLNVNVSQFKQAKNEGYSPYIVPLKLSHLILAMFCRRVPSV